MRKRNKGAANTTTPEATPTATNEAPTEVVNTEGEQVQGEQGTEVVGEVVGEGPTPEQQAEYEALQNRRQELLAELGTIEGKLQAEYRNWTLMTSVIVKPVQRCREVFFEVLAGTEGGGRPPRKAVLDKCTSKGIAPNTAKTQYQVNAQKWERGDLDEQYREWVARVGSDTIVDQLEAE